MALPGDVRAVRLAIRSPGIWLRLLLRWAGTLLFYLSLKKLWPRHDGYLRWLGALLLLYPGFFQQSISTAYERHFTSFFLFMLSVYLMVLASGSRAGLGFFFRFHGSQPSSRSLPLNTSLDWN